MSTTAWDVIVIGAGMSGLGAGIRLALSGKKVLLLEQHNSIGGLNSFYFKNHIKYDVGLHALTNFVPAGTKGAHPLIKICRQLRISYDALQLQEQHYSRIQFPDVSLTFTNDFEHFLAQIHENFPHEKDPMLQLDAAVRQVNGTALEGPTFISARQQLAEFIRDPLLREMLLLPLFYYGSAHSDDIDWRQFVILYQSIYREGFARPLGGVRTILRLLREQYRACGGVLRVKSEVTAIVNEDKHVQYLQLASGERLYASQFLTTIGYPETQMLCGTPVELPLQPLSFAETITTFEHPSHTFRGLPTITFFNRSSEVHYRPADDLLDLHSGVICIPENYGDTNEPQTTLRTTHLASYTRWSDLPPEVYRQQKQTEMLSSRNLAFQLLGMPAPAAILDEDMFTPCTIQRYTKHLDGAIYGFPQKFRSGHIGYDNLFLCGTDQGFLGIVGALLSGISIANACCIR